MPAGLPRCIAVLSGAAALSSGLLHQDMAGGRLLTAAAWEAVHGQQASRTRAEPWASLSRWCVATRINAEVLGAEAQREQQGRSDPISPWLSLADPPLGHLSAGGICQLLP